MPLQFSRSKPFRKYQKAVGNATYLINTTAVGLELVAHGGERPTPLHIKWQKPNQPRQIADQARSFVLVAVLNFAVDSFDSYLRAVGNLEWVGLDISILEIIKKSATRSGGKEYSISERANVLAEAVGIVDQGLVGLTDLLSKWRTSLIHSEAKPIMTRETIRCLKSNKEFFATSYAAIDIVKTLQNFESGRTPTLKEVTTLVAANQNLTSLIDQALIARSSTSSCTIQEIARHTLKILLIDGHTPTPLMHKVWGTDAETRERKLKSILINEGFVFVDENGRSSDPFTTQLAGMEKAEAVKYLGN